MSTMADPITGDVIVESKLLGPLAVRSTQVYTFRDEPYGFPGATEFALLPADRDGFFWLQSLDFEALTFLLIDPFLFVDGYLVEVDADELGVLQPRDASEILVLSILALPREPEELATVNLQGPIVFNIVEQLGKQVVIESPYGLRHPVNVSRSVQDT